MSPQEFEQALHDAEIKLARLKALYEQWFQGIERLEPSVARKDLDRTLDNLKRNMPRNTALRFRTQQLWARYGTYGIYWSRIARQIEEGTYKRDIVRATRKRLTAASRRAADQAYELDLDVDVDLDLDAMEEIPDEKTDPGIAVTKPAAGPRPTASGAPKPLAFDDGDLDAILGSLASPSSAPDAAARNRSARPISPFAMARPAAAASATFGKPKDKAPVPVAPLAAAPATPAPTAAPPTVPTPVAAKPVVPTPAAAAPRPVVPAPAAAAPRPMVPAPAAARPAVPAPAAARPMVPAPAAARPAVPAPAPAKLAAPAPAARSGELDEGQMRAIYSRYVDARRKNNELADVRYESLAQSVQKMMPKLREKHAGKPIDFEVVVQNGKVGLKPKVGG